MNDTQKHRIQSAAFLLVSMFFLYVSAYDTSQAYTIATPYQYPVRPGTDEWSAIKTNSEMVAVCQIPETILKKMTTDALLDSILDYPLLVDLYVYRSIDIGFQEMSKYFDALPEFISRKDAFASVQQKLDAMADRTPTDSRTLLERGLLDYLLVVTCPAGKR